MVPVYQCAESHRYTNDGEAEVYLMHTTFKMASTIPTHSVYIWVWFQSADFTSLSHEELYYFLFLLFQVGMED